MHFKTITVFIHFLLLLNGLLFTCVHIKNFKIEGKEQLSNSLDSYIISDNLYRTYDTAKMYIIKKEHSPKMVTVESKIRLVKEELNLLLNALTILAQEKLKFTSSDEKLKIEQDYEQVSNSLEESKIKYEKIKNELREELNNLKKLSFNQALGAYVLKYYGCAIDDNENYYIITEAYDYSLADAEFKTQIMSFSLHQRFNLYKMLTDAVLFIDNSLSAYKDDSKENLVRDNNDIDNLISHVLCNIDLEDIIVRLGTKLTIKINPKNALKTNLKLCKNNINKYTAPEIMQYESIVTPLNIKIRDYKNYNDDSLELGHNINYERRRSNLLELLHQISKKSIVFSLGKIIMELENYYNSPSYTDVGHDEFVFLDKNANLCYELFIMQTNDTFERLFQLYNKSHFQDIISSFRNIIKSMTSYSVADRNTIVKTQDEFEDLLKKLNK